MENELRCPVCGAAVRAGWKFCRQCASSLAGIAGPASSGQPPGPGVEVGGGDKVGGHKIHAGGDVVFTGPKERITCQLPACGQSVLPEEAFVCDRCNKRMCQRHKDDDLVANCNVCAENVRKGQFEQHRRQMDDRASVAGVTEALLRTTQPRPAFRARVWTQRGMRATTRDLMTVPRDSKDSYRIGEQFTLNVQAERDCYLTLLDVGTTGNVYVLLENHPLRAGAPASLSGPDESRRWVVGPLAGIERLKAFFTLQPVSLFPGTGLPAALGPAGQTSQIITKFDTAGSILRQMPPESWTDATAAADHFCWRARRLTPAPLRLNHFLSTATLGLTRSPAISPVR